MEKELLTKYLNDVCTGEEFDEVAEWIKTEAQHEEGRTWGKEYWNLMETGQKPKDEQKYRSLLYKIHYEINLQGKTESIPITSLQRVAKWISRAAAVLFVPLLGISLYMFSIHDFQLRNYADAAVDSIEIIAPVGSRTRVHLSDGTEVDLNYGSRIKYPRTFGETREITLSGEGYFDVAHNPYKPFIVKAGKLNVKALGTKFNVHAYSGDNLIETTLVEGKVVIEKRQKGTSETIQTLVPGQHVAYHQSSDEIVSTAGHIDKFIAWKDGKVVFDDEPITNIAERLGRMFNVDFEIAGNAREFSYTATFFNDPLYFILDQMAEIAPIKYTVCPSERMPDGTFTKQKIKIEKKL